MKGFTTIELIIVIGILTLLSLGGYLTIINFQKDVLLDNASRELNAQIRSAKAKSQAGEIVIGETYPDDYPKFGIETTVSSYKLKRQDNSTDTPVLLEETDLDPKLSLTVASVYFDRITGKPDAAPTFTITKIGSTDTRDVNIDVNGTVVVIK